MTKSYVNVVKVVFYYFLHINVAACVRALEENVLLQCFSKNLLVKVGNSVQSLAQFPACPKLLRAAFG